MWPLPNASQLIERFEITMSDGRKWQGESYRTNSRRERGRRLVVKDGQKVLFDTDDCHDLANARNSLDLWLAKQEQPVTA